MPDQCVDTSAYDVGVVRDGLAQGKVRSRDEDHSASGVGTKSTLRGQDELEIRRAEPGWISCSWGGAVLWYHHIRLIQWTSQNARQCTKEMRKVVKYL